MVQQLPFHSEFDLRNSVSVKISKILILVVIILSLTHVAYLFLLNSNFENKFALNILLKLFYLDAEQTIPAWFSSCILWSCGVGLLVISFLEKNSSIGKYWFLIGLSLLYVSLDESISLHEYGVTITNNLAARNNIELPDFLVYSWVIPASICVLILAILLIPFFVRLESQLRKALLISGMVYLSGAVGFEMIGGYAAVNSYKTLYLVAMTVEEILEMFGAIILLHATVTQFFYKANLFIKAD